MSFNCIDPAGRLWYSVCCKLGSDPQALESSRYAGGSFYFLRKPPIRQIGLSAWTFIAGHNSTAELLLERLFQKGCSTEQTVPHLIQINFYLRQLGSSQITSWVSSMTNPLQYCSGPHFRKTSGNQETTLSLSPKRW